jgi:hypothetical protein
MSYFRSYFEKNNTLIKDSSVNTAKNPNTELVYGSTFSKFILKVDFNTLKEKVNNSDLVVDSNTRHTLHLTNTIFGDESLKGGDAPNGGLRTNSFDLIVFKIPEFWDEGVGFDYKNPEYVFSAGNLTYDERASNWYYRTTLNQWTTSGVYDTSPLIITGHSGSEIHMDNGNEDIDFDITDYVNGVLSGNTDYGLGIAFAPLYQDFKPVSDQSVAFFTKYTQTFFEPYVQTYFDDIISDDRLSFTEKIHQNLYLYVTKGTNYFNLDSTPVVDITDTFGNVIPGLGNLTTTLVKKGIYKVTFGLDGVTCDGKRFFNDKWKLLSIDGVSISDVTQKFIPKPFSSEFTLGENPTEVQRYAVQFFGVRQLEKIKKGEIRKVVVKFKSIDVAKTILFDEVYYRIYILEGRTQVDVHDWTKIDKTNENSFHLDTSYFIPRQYYIEIKGKTHTEEIFYKESISLEIVSEK